MHLQEEKEDASVETSFKIECWAKPGETDIVSIKRIVADILAHLKSEGHLMPDNIEIIERCSSKGHTRCATYKFGTKVLHVSSQAADAGRLTLVVRCGGGFLDFMEYVKRYGNVEALHWGRQLDSQSRNTVHFTSTLSNGRRQLKEDGKARASSKNSSHLPALPVLNSARQSKTNRNINSVRTPHSAR